MVFQRIRNARGRYGPYLALVLVLACSVAMTAGRPVLGQNSLDAPLDVADIQEVMNAEAPEEALVSEPSGIDLLTLIVSGGRFMIPIALMSVLVVTLAVERMLSLRRQKVLPGRLVSGLQGLTDPVERFDPAKAYKLCLENPSPAGSVIGAMLMRTGQPLAEVEQAASDAVEREADRYASPVRWLSLAAAATPLMGLLGTVWGMIVAFHESTSLSADRSRSEQLSEGIYTALVTTLAGLAVAIPAAIFAQYLENRIAKLFHSVEELAFDTAPGLARFIGHSRLSADGKLSAIGAEEAAPAIAPPPTPPPPPHGPTGVGATGVSPSGAGGKQARAS